MEYVVLLLRAAMVVVCTETAIRYANWWRHVGPSLRWYRSRSDWAKFFKVLMLGDLNGILPPLMLGIAMAQGGIALRHIDIFYYATFESMPKVWAGVILISDLLMLLGTILHLLPAWELSPSPTNQSISTALTLRVIIIITLCVGVIVSDLMLAMMH